MGMKNLCYTSLAFPLVFLLGLYAGQFSHIQKIAVFLEKECETEPDVLFEEEPWSIRPTHRGVHQGTIQTVDLRDWEPPRKVDGHFVQKGWQTIIYSVGVGVDMSFEMDAVDQYNVSVYSFDPTPKAIDYVSKMLETNPLFAEYVQKHKVNFFPFGLYHEDTIGTLT